MLTKVSQTSRDKSATRLSKANSVSRGYAPKRKASRSRNASSKNVRTNSVPISG